MRLIWKYDLTFSLPTVYVVSNSAMLQNQKKMDKNIVCLERTTPSCMRNILICPFICKIVYYVLLYSSWKLCVVDYMNGSYSLSL